MSADAKQIYALTHIQSMHFIIFPGAISAPWRRKTRRGGFSGSGRESAGVHAPPEYMAEQADLLLLHLLETVVLVGVFVAVEAAQADARWQAIDLLHAQLAVVVDGIEVAIDDVADRAPAGVDP